MATDATTRVVEPARLGIPSIELIVVDGPSRGQRARVASGIARIGTAAGNTLELKDVTVSRVHCEIELAPACITLRDCGSTNGTWVEGVRVRDADISAGTVIRVGQTTLRVESSSEPAFLEVSDQTSFGGLVGASVVMRRLYAILERVAATDATVLIQGETGTGKDVAARAIHAASKRASGPFVPIDCGAIAESLIESELFGHVRGAFTGALSDRRGVFEEAAGGTLFLDEIGEMPLDLQPKLLRAIESRTIRRVGSNDARPIDVRIIAATNRSIARSVNEGTFREDLYYRLAVVEVTMPPLRSRRDDIPLLARHFLTRLPDAQPLSMQFDAWLRARAWPGNVRELRNLLERAVALGFANEQPAVSARVPHSTLPAGAESIVPLHLPLKEARQSWVEGFEDVYVRAMLAKTNGNVTHAAELAGVSRRFLQRVLARLGIRSNDEPE